MPELPDYELLKAPDQLPPAPDRRQAGLWVVVAVLVAAAAVAAYIVLRGPQMATSEAPVPDPVVRQEPAGPLGADAAPIVVPPLDQTDALVRELVKQLSSHPSMAAWLATDGLIRNFTVAVANIADGSSPAAHLRVWRPSSGFRVIERGDDLHIDPRSYGRYDTLAAAAASIDPDGAARLYATLKPRIQEAYGDLGSPDTPFDRTLERAIVLLLRTPLLDEPVSVEPRGIGYGFAGADLEALEPVQKLFLRTGSQNVRTVQASLRQVALALGIPAGRLPAR